MFTIKYNCKQILHLFKLVQYEMLNELKWMIPRVVSLFLRVHLCKFVRGNYEVVLVLWPHSETHLLHSRTTFQFTVKSSLMLISLLIYWIEIKYFVSLILYLITSFFKQTVQNLAYPLDINFTTLLCFII